MTDKIEVTQADREAVNCVIVSICPHGHCTQAQIDLARQYIARHAHAARIEGARAALEAVEKELGEYLPDTLDPEQIVKGMSQ